MSPADRTADQLVTNWRAAVEATTKAGGHHVVVPVLHLSLLLHGYEQIKYELIKPRPPGTATDDDWAVLLRGEVGTFAFGPFQEQELARRFADFLTAEVDPAQVVPLSECGPARALVWRSPLVELLDWRDAQRGGDQA